MPVKSNAGPPGNKVTEFEKDIQLLGLLMNKEDTLEEFAASYTRILEGIYNSIMLSPPDERLPIREHLNQGKILKTLLTQQIEYVEELALKEMNEYA